MNSLGSSSGVADIQAAIVQLTNLATTLVERQGQERNVEVKVDNVQAPVLQNLTQSSVRYFLDAYDRYRAAKGTLDIEALVEPVIAELEARAGFASDDIRASLVTIVSPLSIGDTLDAVRAIKVQIEGVEVAEAIAKGQSRVAKLLRTVKPSAKPSVYDLQRAYLDTIPLESLKQDVKRAVREIKDQGSRIKDEDEGGSAAVNSPSLEAVFQCAARCANQLTEAAHMVERAGLMSFKQASQREVAEVDAPREESGGRSNRTGDYWKSIKCNVCGILGHGWARCPSDQFDAKKYRRLANGRLGRIEEVNADGCSLWSVDLQVAKSTWGGKWKNMVVGADTRANICLLPARMYDQMRREKFKEVLDKPVVVRMADGREQTLDRALDVTLIKNKRGVMSLGRSVRTQTLFYRAGWRSTPIVSFAVCQALDLDWRREGTEVTGQRDDVEEDWLECEEVNTQVDVLEGVPNQLRDVVDKFRHLFGPLTGKGSKLPAYPVELHDEGKHVKSPVRRLTPLLKEVVREEVAALMRAGIIRKSRSSFASPLVLVKKKNGKWRMCVDYRRLNALTKTMSMPLRDIQDTLAQLTGKKFFISLDCKSGYHQVDMRREDCGKTAFVTPDGLYEFLKLPFGLKNAPAFFQAAMEEAFGGLVGRACLIFMDDILVMAESREELKANLKQVLERCDEYELRLGREKCDFNMVEVEFLGHIISEKGISMSDKRAEGIVQMTDPQCKADARRFVGMVNYFNKFCPGLAVKVKPIAEIMGPVAKWTWGKAQVRAVEEVKNALKKRLLLNHITYAKDLVLRTDASDVGCGAMLLNRDEAGEYPVAVTSKAFNATQRAWTVGEREAFAIIYAVKKWEGYLRGVPFTIETDHKNLTFVEKSASAKVTRWRLELMEYAFDIVHIPGQGNEVADLLSRHVQEATGRPKRTRRRPERIMDEDFLQIMDSEQEESDEEVDEDDADGATGDDEEAAIGPPPDPGPEAELQRRAREGNLSEEDKKDLIKMGHAGEAQHIGVRSTQRVLNAKGYRWRGMKKTIREVISQCPCQKLATRPKVEWRMGTTMVDKPFDTVAIDTVKITPESAEGYKYVFTVVDHFTRWVEFMPAMDKSAESAAQAVLQWVGRFGCPRTLHSDRGTEYVNRVIGHLVRPLGIDQTQTLPYHPEGNGLCERANRKLVERLRSLLMDWGHYDKWERVLPVVQGQWNNAFHRGIGTSPANLVLGMFKPEPYPGIVNARDALVRVEGDELEVAQEQQEWLAMARKKALEAQKNYLSEREKGQEQSETLQSYSVGDLVMLTPSVKGSKLSPSWRGPYAIVRDDGFGVVARSLENAQDTLEVHKRRVKRYNRGDQSDAQLVELCGRDAQEELVEAVTGARISNGEWLFAVKWADGDTTWEPYFIVRELRELDRYLSDHPDVKAAMGSRM